ncbi:MAG: hypothetical protein QMD11_07925 [Smithella sp.]|nr:hypothetical protein [Smithella sp.]
MPSTPNTLTNLIPTLYLALDVVSRELVGFIPAVTRDPQLARAAIGQTVRSFVAPAAAARNVVADRLRPDDGEQVIGNIILEITKSRTVPIRWQGEESMQMNSAGGPGVSNIMVDQFAQAMRTLVNEIESDLGALYKGASRGLSAADTTLFKTNLADAANIYKLLADNGAPLTDLQLVIGTTEGAALRTLTNLTRVSEAGTDSLLRQGIILDLLGISIRESAQIKRPAIGTEANATVNASAYAIGDMVITLANVGTGTVVEGDLVVIAGDTNQYVCTETVPTVANGTLKIAAPGLRQAIASGSSPAIAITVIGNRNMAFSKSAIILATRMPALPADGDMAVDRTTITDPRSGLSLEVAKYLEYRQAAFEISIAWGVKAVKTAHIGILAGA